MKAGKLIFGLLLVGIGLLGFIDALDIWDPGNLWRWWPLVLIAIGLSSEVDAFRARRNDGGAFMLAVGVWMLIGTQHWWGLSVGRAMPIGIMVLGLGVLLHAIFDRPAPEKKEENAHDVC